MEETTIMKFQKTHHTLAVRFDSVDLDLEKVNAKLDEGYSPSNVFPLANQGYLLILNAPESNPPLIPRGGNNLPN